MSAALIALALQAAPQAPADWNRDVRPILAERCFACHGPDEGAREGGVRLDTAEGLAHAFRGGARVVVPGAPEESELWLLVTEEDPELRMPPEEAGDPLTEMELDTLRRWIEEGATWAPHWAYAPFREVTVPQVADPARVRNPVDAFVQAALEREGRTLLEEADRRTLLRRVSLDLTGLPPTPEELAAFLADEGSGAYERAVDRLLASPHHAERQARLWPDLARYADSHGFTIDGGRSMWPYRDWVIGAIAADLPYDRFTLEQLAGDLLPEPTLAQRVATGFHRNTQVNQEGGAKDEENRLLAVVDRVDTTATVWLGSTMACARCHTHKFDPVTQVEYHELLAFFDQTTDGGVTAGPALPVPTPEREAEVLRWLEEGEARRAELAAAEAEARAGWRVWRPTRATGSNGPELRPEEDGSFTSLGQNPQTSDYVLEGRVPAGGFSALRLEALPTRSLPKGGPGRSGSGNFVLERVRVLARPAADPGAPFLELDLVRAEADHSQGFGPEGGNPYPVAAALEDEPREGWAIGTRTGQPHVAHFHLERPLASEEAFDLKVVLEQNWGSNHVLGRFRVLFDEPGVPAHGPEVPVRWRDAWQAHADHEGARPGVPTTLVMEARAVPRETRVFVRGNVLDPGERVSPGVPAAMTAFEFEGPLEDRLDLARWLTHPENALAHRVTVNRWWQQLFGRGLVATENDFGIRGARPTHPDLLEWLAGELVRSGFSRRHLLRTLVTSATYRQRSRAGGGPPAYEGQRRLRLDAESIRDSALAASGLLERRVGGPPVQPPQPDGVFAFTQSRKGWQAAEGPDRFRRTLYTRLWRSSTYPFLSTFDAPPATVTCNRRERSNTPLQALTMANDPMIQELAAGLGARVREEAEGDAARLALAFELCLARPPEAAELAVLEEHLAAQRARHGDEARAWTAVARVLLNLDEFLTRE